MIFVHKQFSSLNSPDVILELNILLFRKETTEGLVSIPKSIRDCNQEQSAINGHLKLGFMGLYRCYLFFFDIDSVIFELLY